MKKILFVGSEAMPYAATGGLGDVLGSLPIALAVFDSSNDIRVLLPLYSAVDKKWRHKMQDEAEFILQIEGRRRSCRIKSHRRGRVVYYFVENEHYFGRPKIYGYADDAERYSFLSLSALELMGVLGFYPDILHVHDWHGAPAALYLKQKYRNSQAYKDIRSLLTIHNIEYQGQFEFGVLGDAPALGGIDREILELDGKINLMKAGIVSADMVSTVSPRYADEILTREGGRGLERVLDKRRLVGILNGIDYDYYNPEKDPELSANYNENNVTRKYLNRAVLQQSLGLVERELPLLAIISRLASHKGLDLIAEIAERLITERDIQLVLLGQGEERFEDLFRDLETKYPERVRAIIDYDRALSKRIYAAADIFLMPSLSEPCGLSQMIASRYGAIPIVRKTGGLYDSIKDFDEVGGELQGNGFTFDEYSSAALLDRIDAALELWHDRERRLEFIGKIMRVDFSWGASAEKYMEIYEYICGNYV